MPPALALDIDGTINTGDFTEIERLTQRARQMGITTYINTARSQLYCDDPSQITTRLTGDSSDNRHFCLVHSDPPTSKVINMQKIAQQAGCPPHQALLIDDRPENIDAVRKAGFRAMYVDASTGIQKQTADDALLLLKSMVGHRVSSRHRRRRLALLVAFVAVLLIGLILFL